MAEVFYDIVSRLSLEERWDLLQKLKRTNPISGEALQSEEWDSGAGLNAKVLFERESWFFRFWFSILGIFKSKNPVKLYENARMVKLGRKIESSAPAMFDYKKDRLLPAFYERLERLKAAAGFFHHALNSGFSLNRGAFFGFLASLEIPELHKRILEETNPDMLEQRFPEDSETDLRKKAVQAMEDTLKILNTGAKTGMYGDSRSLHCLRELSSFPFDRILTMFSPDPALKGNCCPPQAVMDSLLPLAHILYSIKAVPPMTLLESLFIFSLQEKEPSETDGLWVSGGTVGAAETAIKAAVQAELEKMMKGAETALESIRTFNAEVPLLDILRFSSRDMELSPREISGGEDWLVIYREYWRGKIEDVFTASIESRKGKKLQNAFDAFLKGTEIKPLSNAVSAGNPGGFPVRGAYTLAFLRTFYSTVFIPEMNDAIKIILLEGDFFLKQDNTLFTEIYSVFFNLENNIRKFDKSISPEGDIGGRYELIKREMNGQPLAKRRKIELLSNEAAAAARKIIDPAVKAAQNMTELLSKILVRNTEGGTIANIDWLIAQNSGAGQAVNLLQSLTDSIEILQQFNHIMEDIEVFESASR